MTRTRSTRRTFLGGLTAAAVSVPTLLRAQPRTVARSARQCTDLMGVISPGAPGL